MSQEYVVGKFVKVAKLGGRRITVILSDSEGAEVACYFADCVLPSGECGKRNCERPRRLVPGEEIAYVPDTGDLARAKVWRPVNNWS